MAVVLTVVMTTAVVMTMISGSVRRPWIQFGPSRTRQLGSSLGHLGYALGPILGHLGPLPEEEEGVRRDSEFDHLRPEGWKDMRDRTLCSTMVAALASPHWGSRELEFVQWFTDWITPLQNFAGTCPCHPEGS